MLAELPRTSTELGGYDSGATYWNFTTENGCDTRNRVLRLQAVSPAQWTGAIALLPPKGSSPECPVTQGSWQTPYDNAETPLNLATQADISSAIAIDHVVPKANAWATGAANWMSYGVLGTWALREFSNDLGSPELLAVSSTSNSSKGDSSPEEWMPNNTGMTCPYIKAWIAVKYNWALAVSTTVDAPSNPIGTSELTFLQNTLKSC